MGVYSFFIVLAIIFIVAFTVLILRKIMSKTDSPTIQKAILIPFGCLGALIILTMIYEIYSWLFIEPQDADHQRYEEIFGYTPTIQDYNITSNYQGHGIERIIYMRLKVTQKQQKRLLNIQGLKSSALTRNDIAKQGNRHVSRWWLGLGANTIICDSGKVYEVENFNRWKTLILVQCPVEAQEFSKIVAHNFIIARGRTNE